MSVAIDTDDFSARMRAKAVRVEQRQLLVAKIGASAQAADLKKPANCNGFGRVRHFQRDQGPEWPQNPLPIDPAVRALELAPGDALQAQVFQNAACNWRCWYCFVPFPLLDGNEASGGWFRADELLDLYLAEPEATRPRMIDLTGGQPDLVPEWVPWTMEALRDRSLESKVFLWSDDNLSNDYFWRFLSSCRATAISDPQTTLKLTPTGRSFDVYLRLSVASIAGASAASGGALCWATSFMFSRVRETAALPFSSAAAGSSLPG